MKPIAPICLLLAISGCAHRVGSQTTSGAISELEQRVDAEPGQKPAEAIAGRATKGVIAELNDPAQQAQIDALLTNATDSFRSALAQGLAGDLGAHGDGPLGQSIAATAERSAAAAARAAITTLLATCDPASPSCLDRRVSDLSTRAAVAFVDGVKRSLGLAALVIAFAAGAATVLLLGVLWMVARRLGDLRGSRGGKRGRSELTAPTFDTRPSASRST